LLRVVPVVVRPAPAVELAERGWEPVQPVVLAVAAVIWEPVAVVRAALAVVE
jgi:hypothetical protein